MVWGIVIFPFNPKQPLKHSSPIEVIVYSNSSLVETIPSLKLKSSAVKSLETLVKIHWLFLLLIISKVKEPLSALMQDASNTFFTLTSLGGTGLFSEQEATPLKEIVPAKGSVHFKVFKIL